MATLVGQGHFSTVLILEAVLTCHNLHHEWQPKNFVREILFLENRFCFCLAQSSYVIIASQQLFLRYLYNFFSFSNASARISLYDEGFN